MTSPTKMKKCNVNSEHGVCLHRFEKGRTETNPLSTNRIGYVWPDMWRCNICAKEANRRKYEKSVSFHCMLKEERCGCCERCGYDEHPEILQWHHERDKEFEISRKKITEKNLHKVRAEISKCVLLCPNCHCIEHTSVEYHKVLEKQNGIFK